MIIITTMLDLQKRIEDLNLLLGKQTAELRFKPEDSIKVMDRVQKFIEEIKPNSLIIIINGRSKRYKTDSSEADFVLEYNEPKPQ